MEAISRARSIAGHRKERVSADRIDVADSVVEAKAQWLAPNDDLPKVRVRVGKWLNQV